MSQWWRASRGAVLGIALVAAALPAAAGTSAVADLQVHIGADDLQWGLFGDDAGADTGENPIWSADRGAWTAEPVPEGDHLRLRMTLAPPEVNPILGLASATLVTGVGIDHGLRTTGDVGHSRRFGFTWTPLDACTGDPCTYTADVTVSLRQARRYIATTPGIESPVVVIGFTLVRTFGGGQWLQVSGIQDGADGRRSTTLAAVTRVEGAVWRAPVTPSGEAHVAGLREAPNPGFDELGRLLGTPGDGSSPVPTVTVRVDVRASGCEAYTGVQLMDDWGTLPLAGSVATIGPAGPHVAIPDGTSWALLVRGTTIGEFVAAGQDQVVTATVTCTIDDGGNEVVAGRSTVEPPLDPLPDPPAPVAWLVAVESGRRDRPLNPALPAAMPSGFVVVERTHDRGWVVDRSRDGTRWEPVSDARLPAALRNDTVRGPRIAATGGRAVLAGIVADGEGGDLFVSWSSTDAGRWVPGAVSFPAGRPAATSLTLRSVVAAEGRWFALADGDGATGGFAWTSPDGRSWTGREPRTPDGTSLVAVAAGPSHLVGVARPADPSQPDLLVRSLDGRRWSSLAALPVGRAEAVALGETAGGRIVVAFGRSAVAPIEAWVSEDDGDSWTMTLDGSVGVQLDGVTVHDETVVVTGSVRYGERGLGASPWVAVSRDGAATWRVERPVNGNGDGRCTTAAVVGPAAAILTVTDCNGNPTPRWRAVLGPRSEASTDPAQARVKWAWLSSA